MIKEKKKNMKSISSSVSFILFAWMFILQIQFHELSARTVAMIKLQVRDGPKPFRIVRFTICWGH